MTDMTAPGLRPTAASPRKKDIRSQPQWRRSMRRFFRRPMAVIGLVLVVGFLLVAVIGPILAPNPDLQNFNVILQSPSAAHPFGADDLGRDVLARIVNGAWVSLLAGVMSTAIALVIGITLGLITGFYRGWFDIVLMRIVDVLLAFPFLIFAVGLAAILGASLTNVIIA